MPQINFTHLYMFKDKYSLIYAVWVPPGSQSFLISGAETSMPLFQRRFSFFHSASTFDWKFSQPHGVRSSLILNQIPSNHQLPFLPSFLEQAEEKTYKKAEVSLLRASPPISGKINQQCLDRLAIVGFLVSFIMGAESDASYSTRQPLINFNKFEVLIIRQINQLMDLASEIQSSVILTALLPVDRKRLWYAAN